MTVTRRTRRRESGFRLAAIACAVLVLVGCAAPHSRPLRGDEQRAAVPAEERTPDGSAKAESAADGAADRGHADRGHADHREHGPQSHDADREPRPVAVEVPAIGVAVDLVGVGLNQDGSMEVPAFGHAGWYAKGPRPGAAGPAVIVAHYDSTDGPDVFYELASLETGDEVLVHREDGSVARFVVQHLEQHPKEDLPADRIWAASNEARLTLITCGGVFDRVTGHYTDNVIAYTTAA